MLVYVNSVSVYTENLVVENVVTNSPDSATFDLVNPDNEPQSGQSVEVYRDSTSNVLFKGIIIAIDKSQIAPNQVDLTAKPFRYSVEAMDYQALLNEKLVADSFVSKNCKQIISDIVVDFTDSAHGITINNVDTGPIIDEINFDYVKVRDAFADLANLVNYDWYIDYDKDIHFFEKETIPAPFNIDNTASKEYIFNLL